MDLIEELRNGKKAERPPGKRAVSAYLSPQQYERLEALAGRSGLSFSKVIGRLVDIAVEQQMGKGG